MTTSSNRPKPNASELDAEFTRLYTPLLNHQTKRKAELAKLYRENRYLRARLGSVPESSISTDVLDVRDNKNAPRLQDLLSPGEELDRAGREIDPALLNYRRILGGIEIDVQSLEDEISTLESRNRGLREFLRGRGGTVRRGLLVVDLEDEDEDEGEEVMKSVEGKEEMMPAIPEEGGELDEDSKDGAQASGSPREEGEKAMKKAIENSLQDKSGR